MSSPLVLAVDGTGLLVRCDKAARRAMRLTASDGTATGTIHMLIGSLAKKLRAIQPGYLIIAWDGPHSRDWRREIYPGYKASRPHRDDDGSAERLAMEFCEAAGIRQLMVPGFEADDLLAALQRSAIASGYPRQLCLYSEDGDLEQLLGDAMTWIIRTGSDVAITERDVVTAWHVHPGLLTRVRALCGDPSDGIPGLSGIGQVRAAQMLVRGQGQWPLPEEVLPDPEQRDQVEAWRQVMDLLDPPRRPEHAEGVESDYFALDARAEWHREVSDSLRDFFLKYELSSLSQRAAQGRLW